jgi:ABC-type multidrug transport system ATPase subunit
MIDGLPQLGKTIFLTTHYLDETEALADRIAVIKAGVIVAEGTPADRRVASGRHCGRQPGWWRPPPPGGCVE